jgi:hypothetical protein
MTLKQIIALVVLSLFPALSFAGEQSDPCLGAFQRLHRSVYEAEHNITSARSAAQEAISSATTQARKLWRAGDSNAVPKDIKGGVAELRTQLASAEELVAQFRNISETEIDSLVTRSRDELVCLTQKEWEETLTVEQISALSTLLSRYEKISKGLLDYQKDVARMGGVISELARQLSEVSLKAQENLKQRNVLVEWQC